MDMKILWVLFSVSLFLNLNHNAILAADLEDILASDLEDAATIDPSLQTRELQPPPAPDTRSRHPL